MEKIGEIKLHSNDSLSAFSDGTFRYYDSYGNVEEFEDPDCLFTWLSENQIDITEEIEKFSDLWLGDWIEEK